MSDDAKVCRLWTRQKLFQYHFLEPGAAYSIPVFVSGDIVADTFFTDIEGRPLPCCQDYAYEALDHRLYWVKCTASPSGSAALHVFCGMPCGCGGPRLCRADQVLELAEFFRGGARSIFSHWKFENPEGSRPRISVESFMGIGDGGIGTPRSEPAGNCLWIEPGVSTLMRRAVQAPPAGRVHLRAHFYDDGEKHSCQWLGRESATGTGAVGLFALANKEDEFYGYKSGSFPTSAATCPDLVKTFVPRTIGWHVFELVWEQRQLHVIIDGEPVATEPAAGSSANEEVCLFSSGTTGYGVWSGIELFYSPIGQTSWVLGAPATHAAAMPPWEHVSEQEGFWQDSGDHVVEKVSICRFSTLVHTWPLMVAAFDAVQDDPTVVIHPIMQQMLGQSLEIIDERDDGMIGLLCPDGYLRFFPPAVQLPEDKPPEPALALIPDPASASILDPVPESIPAPGPGELVPLPVERGIALECWSKPSESDREQIERVVAHFLEYMHAQDVAIPDNIRMVSQCKEAAHKRCFVYRFGTRRLHFQARSQDDGRLLLVVRCGGGFMDFVDFARRHGGLEVIKLRRQLPSTGIARVNAVLSNGRIRASQQMNCTC